ncbi:hypothetical protein HAX54_029479 [Datura stramonium]|uniref:Uncharacterized protein n=1 Tax=Datura stramonium TaxID=4076 RepID=A0ABS8V606_DATST|nr:hypothetical protein [Datura stramonium]
MQVSNLSSTTTSSSSSLNKDTTTFRCICGDMDLNTEKGQNHKRDTAKCNAKGCLVTVVHLAASTALITKSKAIKRL